jgi:hypothetical protein
MGEFIWYFIMATVVGTAFLPLILREKCPTCKRRVLKQVNPLDVIDPALENEKPRFVTYFWCEPCDQIVRQIRTNPMEVIEQFAQQKDASDAVLAGTGKDAHTPS